MGAVDFVVGILVGILLACVSFVLQTSQVSAVRGSLPGGVANSTVRRHPIQNRFLQEAGRQIYVMKLAGYLFFGTIVGVETKIRELLANSFPSQSIRFLVLDLHNVDGVDFSAAEAFTRINRILKSKEVKIIICGISIHGTIGKSLCNVGLFDGENTEDEVQYFESLNSALEYCENYLLKSFYDQQRNALTGTSTSSSTICKALRLLG
jgi:sulfate permease, SulP family